MKGFNPLAAVTAAVKELTAFVKAEFATVKAEFATVKAEFATVKAELKEIRENQKRMEQKLDFLVAEVSRYKNDSDELLVSVYAYCTQERISFTHNDLFKWGGLATRISRRMGAKVEKTNDPRFGEVNLYERHILDNTIL